MSEAPRARVRQGELVGRIATTQAGVAYYSFQGVPYAKPPVGSLRFKAPEPAEEWSEARDATAEGGACAQTPAGGAFVGSEDCLYLNVYTPCLEGEFLPVLVWIHPGDFVRGCGDADVYGPDWLVERDVVVVTLNYRLGPLGFLALHTPDLPGNAGLKDQALALEWVRENIAAFGGNSGNVTVAGAGTGAACASLLTLAPRTRHLMQKVVLQSGTALNEFALHFNPSESARALAKALGCDSDDPDETFLFLQAVSARDLVETAARLQLSFAPVVEEQFLGTEAFLTENPLDILASRTPNVAVLIGKTTFDAAEQLSADFAMDDLRKFIPNSWQLSAEEELEVVSQLRAAYPETLTGYVRLASDARFGADINRYVNILLQTSNRPVYCYEFGYVGGLNRLKPVIDRFGLAGAGHLDELGYLWRPLRDVDVADDDRRVRDNMLLLWTNFVKTGNPIPLESELGVTWPPTQRERGCRLRIDRELVLQRDADPQLQLWDQLYAKYYKIWNTPTSPGKSADVLECGERNRVVDIPVNASFEYESIKICHEDESSNRDEGVDSEDPIRGDQQPPVPDTVVEADANQDIEEKSHENCVHDSSESDCKAKYRWSAEVKVEENLSEITVSLKSPAEVKESEEIASPAIEITSPPDSPVKEEMSLENAAELEDLSAQIVTEEVEGEQNGKTDGKINGNNIEIDESSKGEELNYLVDKEKSEIKDTVNGKSENFEILVKEEQEVMKKTDKTVSDEGEKAKPKLFEVSAPNGAAKDIIRANDPPEDDLPKNIGVNKFVSFFESLGGKKK